MRLQYLGHAAFWMKTRSGGRLVTDPYQPGAFGALHLKPLDIEADVVTVSHDHLDHNYVQGVQGSPQVISSPGPHEAAGFKIKGIPTYHDRSQGKERGSNLMFVIEAEGIRILHCGDLGHPLTETERSEIGPIDLLLVPVGGTYTLDAKGARDLVKFLSPKIVIPMHYKVGSVQFPIDPVDEFLRLMPEPKRLDRSETDLEPPLPDTNEVWLLPPARV